MRWKKRNSSNNKECVLLFSYISHGRILFIIIIVYYISSHPLPRP